jgi:hypothetical protein
MDLDPIFFELSSPKVGKKHDLSLTKTNFCKFFVQNANFDPSYL